MASPPLAPRTAQRRSPSYLYARSKPHLDPDEAAPGTVEPWEAVEPVRPDTAHVRALRIMDAAGEILVGLAIIAGGVLAYGFLPFA